jgi:phage baseplate assembly protein W
MRQPVQISWTKRVCYCRLFVWAYSVRDRRYGGLIWMLCIRVSGSNSAPGWIATDGGHGTRYRGRARWPYHIRQSVADILSTPMGTRVGRRDYGSLVPELIDQPMTPANILRLYAATAVALTRWEDRLRLRRVGLVVGERPGSAQVVLDARRTDTASANALVRLSIPLTPNANSAPGPASNPVQGTRSCPSNMVSP